MKLTSMTVHPRMTTPTSMLAHEATEIRHCRAILVFEVCVTLACALLTVAAMVGCQRDPYPCHPSKGAALSDAWACCERGWQ